MKYKPLLFLVIGIIAGIMPLFWNKEVFYCCDNTTINIPGGVYWAREIQQGRFPLWNPYIFSGTPILADINLHSLYPGNFLYIFFPPFVALTVLYGVHFCLGILGMYASARRFNISQWGSVVSGLIYGYSGTLLVYTGNEPMYLVATLLPWCIWAWLGIVQKETVTRYALLIGFLSLQVIAGHPQLTFYSWILYVCIFFVWSSHTVIHRLRIYLTVSVSVLGLTSVQLIPFIDFARYTNRVTEGIDYASQGAIKVITLGRFLLPQLVGSVRLNTAWVDAGSMYGYIGVIPLILSAFGKRNKVFWMFWVIAVISFLFALGRTTPVFSLFYTFVPGIRYFRTPAHMLLLTTVALSFLAGHGIDRKERGSSVHQFLTSIFLIFACIGLFCFVGQRYIPSAYFENTWMNVFPEVVLRKIHRFDPKFLRMILTYIGVNALFTSIVLWQWKKYVQRGKSYAALTTLFIFIELYVIVWSQRVTVPLSNVQAWQNERDRHTSAVVKANTLSSGLSRIFVDRSLDPYPYPKPYDREMITEETQWQHRILRPNLQVLSGVGSIDGYASMVDTGYQQEFTTEKTNPTGINTKDISVETLKRFGVSFVYSKPNDFRYLSTHRVENITTNDDFSLWHIRDFVQIVLIGSEVPVSTTFTSHGIEAEVDVKDTSVFTANIRPFWGWQVYVDGEKTMQWIEDGIRVQVPAGKHRISYRFIPHSHWIGLGISIATILMFAVYFFYQRARK